MAQPLQKLGVSDTNRRFGVVQWLRLVASLALLGWFIAIAWGMLSSFNLAALSGRLLNFQPGSALASIFAIPKFDVLGGHGLLLLAALWLTLLAAALGVWLGQLLGIRLGDEPPLLGMATAIALGYAGACLLFTTLNLCGLLYGWLVWTLTLLWSAATAAWLWQRRGLSGWWQAYRLAMALRNTVAALRTPGRNFFALILWCAALSSALLALATALAPPVLYDTTFYHLAMPRQYVAHHGFVPVLTQIVILFAQGMEFLYTWPLALFGGDNWFAGSIAALMQWQMGIITTIAIYGFCRVLHLGRTAALLAASTYLVQPLVNRVIGTAYVDAGNAFFTILCLYALYRWWHSEQQGWLTAAALLAGTATAVKVFGGPLLLLMLALVAAKWWTRRRAGPQADAQAGQPKTLAYLRLAIVAPTIAALVASYSYIASWLVLGNPLWPLANNIFHGWNSAIGDANYKQLVNYLFTTVDQGPAKLELASTLKYLFWNLWLDEASPIRDDMIVPRTVPIITALLPMILLLGGGALWQRWHGGRSDEHDKPDVAIWWATGYALILIILWLVVQGQRRYILFTLPLLAVGCGWVYQWLRQRLRLVSWGYVAFVALALYSATMSNLAFNYRAFPNVYGLLPDNFYVLEGAVVRLGEGGQTMLYLNRVAPSNQKVLVTEQTAPLYYLGRDYLATNPGWDDFLNYDTLKTAADFGSRLNQLNVSYLVDMRDQNYLAPLRQSGLWPGRSQLMHLVYTQGNWYTYQRDATAAATGLSLNVERGQVGLVGFNGGVPPDLSGASNLDGIDRMKPNVLRRLSTIIVKQAVPKTERTELDSIAIYAPDAATIEGRLAQVAPRVSDNDAYHVYDVRNVDLLPVFGQQAVPLNPAEVRLRHDESKQAQAIQGSSSITLTLPLTGTASGQTANTSAIELDRQGPPIAGISAELDTHTPSMDVRNKPVLLADVEVSSGAMLRVIGDVDGVTTYLLWRFNGNGDGVADQMVVYLPLGTQRLANLRFILQAPQGGTGNIIGGKLDTTDGQAQVKLVLKSISIFGNDQL